MALIKISANAVTSENSTTKFAQNVDLNIDTHLEKANTNIKFSLNGSQTTEKVAKRTIDHASKSIDMFDVLKIQSNKYFQTCMKIYKTIETCMDKAIGYQAAQMNDTSGCININDEDSRRSCQTKVVYSHAITTQNEDICKELSDDRMMNLCRSQIISDKATSKQDITLCDTLETDTSFDMCRLRVIRTSTSYTDR